MVKDNTINHFTDLDAWKINHKAVLLGYRIMRAFPSNERYGITDQLRRALISITSNIAEGWGIYYYANKIRYYYMSRGSSCEVQNLLVISHDLGILSDKEYIEIKQIIFEGYKLINGLIRSIEKRK